MSDHPDLINTALTQFLVGPQEYFCKDEHEPDHCDVILKYFDDDYVALEESLQGILDTNYSLPTKRVLISDIGKSVNYTLARMRKVIEIETQSRPLKEDQVIYWEDLQLNLERMKWILLKVRRDLGMSLDFK